MIFQELIRQKTSSVEILPIVHVPYRSLARPSRTRQKMVPGHRGVKVYPMLFDANVNPTRNMSSTPVWRYCFDPEWLFFMLVIALCIGFGLMPLLLKNSFTTWRSLYTLTQYAHFDRNYWQNMTSICCYCLDPEWLFFMLVIALCIGFGLMPLLLKNTFDSVKQDQDIFTYTNKPIEY